MAKCEICGKNRRTGHRISITRSQVSRRANRDWKPNVHGIKVLENGAVVKRNVCTQCMRSNKVIRVSSNVANA